MNDGRRRYVYMADNHAGHAADREHSADDHEPIDIRFLARYRTTVGPLLRTAPTSNRVLDS
ncbi:hypothetical protein GCM10027258_39680 [Amycolatopsis stemonae]